MKHIALFQTGGTINMLPSKDGTETLVSRTNMDVKMELPELSNLAQIDHFDLFSEDSSNLNPSHWDLLIETIKTHYSTYDGFVVLHGTDTMAYTASALSFGIRNLNKPIVFTGSQIPISNIRSDAHRNMINAVELATLDFNEVTIAFNDRLFRANRATKLNIEDFDAFESPNCLPLAEIGIDIDLYENRLLPKPSQDVYFLNGFSNSILTIKVWPGMLPPAIESLSHYKAVIIESFGCGNLPVKGPFSFVPFLEATAKLNLPVIITSQAVYDDIDLSKYESGSIAASLGCISASDMTFESTLTKTMHLLQHVGNGQNFRLEMERSIAGEKDGF